MKRFLVFAVVLALTLVAVGTPASFRYTFAQNTDPTSIVPGQGESDYCDPASGDLGAGRVGCGLDDFQKLLQRIIKYVTIIVIPIAVGVIIYAGFVMMISGATGGEERISHAKTMITVALWGIAIALGSYLIINAIFSALTGGDFNETIQNINATN